jgi:hypothetical protein
MLPRKGEDKGLWSERNRLDVWVCQSKPRVIDAVERLKVGGVGAGGEESIVNEDERATGLVMCRRRIWMHRSS